jgi:gamma-glutamyltranspeptidase/glutathione hydrolase
MVAAAFPDATQAGVEMLRRGGNAMDAACAAALALGVCEPQGSGLGGQTVALLHTAGKTVAIDGSSRAPALAHPDRLKRARSRERGYRATTVPSTVAVLAYLNRRYGRLDWDTVLQPAIQIAGGGYRITELQQRLQTNERRNFLAVPSRSGARYFLKDGVAPYDPGDLFVQEDLARTLSRLASEGYEDFYRGEIALRIDADMKRHRGLVRAEDLALIPEVIERAPLTGRYRGLEIRAFPPPGSGHTLLLILALMDRLPPERLTAGTPESYRTIAETIRLGLVDNREHPHNPNPYHQAGHAEAVPALADRLVARLKDGISRPAPASARRAGGAGETTHLSAMDDEGNVVGLTQSINLVYGSKAAAEDLGFLYNDYIEAFQYGRPGHYYDLRPGGIPWASAAPTMVFAGDRPWLVVGSPGSQRIFASIAQFLCSVVDGGEPIGEAMAKPRLHCTEDGELMLEAERFGPEVVAHLEASGYRINPQAPFSFFLGAIHAVLKRQTGAGYQGVADVRRDGLADGP